MSPSSSALLFPRRGLAVLLNSATLEFIALEFMEGRVRFGWKWLLLQTFIVVPCDVRAAASPTAAAPTGGLVDLTSGDWERRLDDPSPDEEDESS